MRSTFDKQSEKDIQVSPYKFDVKRKAFRSKGTQCSSNVICVQCNNPTNNFHFDFTSEGKTERKGVSYKVPANQIISEVEEPQDSESSSHSDESFERN